MTGSVALDVVIGLVFVYLLYSLLATILLEIVATTLSLRARNLHTAIDRMLSDEIKSEDTRIFNLEIFGWLPGGWLKTKLMWILIENKLMSLLWETLGDFFSFFRKGAGIYTKEFYASPEIKYQSKDTLFRKPPYLEAASFSKAIIDLFKEKGTGGSDIERISNYVAKIETDYPETGKYLKSLIHDAHGDIQNFKALLEQWFDKMMFRATGWYKRKTQFILVYVGMLLAIFFNVNTIQIAKVLSTSPEVRNNLVNQAAGYLKEYDSVEINSTDPSTKPDTARLKKRLAETQAKIDSVNSVLGLGWRWDKRRKIEGVVTTRFRIWGWREENDTIVFYTPKQKASYLASDSTAKVIPLTERHVSYAKLAFHSAFSNGNFWGLLLTALAISLGSPFWFDLLNKLMRLRGVGSKIDSGDIKPEKGEKITERPLTFNINGDAQRKAVG